MAVLVIEVLIEIGRKERHFLGVPRVCECSVVSGLFAAILQLDQSTIFTPQPLRAVRVLFSPMVSGRAVGWVCVWVVGGKKFVRAVSQKP